MSALTDLLKAAQQRQQELQAIEAQKTEVEKNERQKELAIEKQEFESLLQMYAGDIFDRLDDDMSQIEPRLHGGTVLRVNVFHRMLSLKMSSKPVHYEPTGMWKVCDELRREYWNVPKVNFSSKEERISSSNLSDYLLLRILQISEEHDSVLAQVERMNAEKAKEELIEAQKREAESRLRLFSEALYALNEQSSEKIRLFGEAAIANQWTWPKDFVLDLYKVSWCTGAYRSDEYEETEFDYDSGWSLSDISVTEPEYFVLLPERYGSARTVKTSSPLTVERFRFTEATLPDRLFDLPEKIDIELVSIEFTLGYSKQRFKLLPEFVPPVPSGCKVSVENCISPFDLRRLPCIEIRQAIDAAVTSTAPSSAPLDDDIHF
jgi:hypothetical protein